MKEKEINVNTFRKHKSVNDVVFPVVNKIPDIQSNELQNTSLFDFRCFQIVQF